MYGILLYNKFVVLFRGTPFVERCFVIHTFISCVELEPRLFSVRNIKLVENHYYFVKCV
jgi:hypothetical protein